ncbi:MAG: FkbM family methyltransferase [Burkholderiales bacterium]
MARDLATLIRDLAWLRRYRARKAQRAPWWVRIPYLRNVLRHQALDHWPGSYVIRTDGRIVYVPKHVDVTAGHRLFKPATHIELIEPLCRPGDCVLDVGANVGDWTLPMASRVGPLGKVLAFEPVAYLAETIVKTARVNRHNWVEVHQVALSSTDGTGEFSVERANSGGSRLGRLNGDFSHTTVRTARLDTMLAARPDIGRIDFVKIDVEGFEEAVLQGARASLARFRPGLLIESGLESREQRKSIHDLLTSLDYEPIGSAVPGGLIEISWSNYRENEEVLARIGLCNLLFMPR